VPISRIIDKARETNATAIGLSALLVSTSKQMPLCVKELHHQGLEFPVIIGGAAINRGYAQRTLFVEDDTPYDPGVFYAKDAFEGLALMDRIINPDERVQLVEKTVAQARAVRDKPGREAFSVPEEAAVAEGKTVRDVEPPTPPFWGVRDVDDLTLAVVWPHLDLKTLYRLHWGGKGVKDEAWEKLQAEEFNPRLKAMQEEAEQTGWLAPRVRYGYFPANGDGNDLVIFDPDDPDQELARFTFPRQPRRERLCLADYFLPLSSGKRDVAAFQIVTMGDEATRRTERFQAAGEYTEAYFSHGLSVQSAEGLAEYTHQRIRRELGIGEETGKRYSWGYPACPDLSQHGVVEQLLDSRSIGIAVTDGYQFMPEQTTAALVVPHPDAKYYALARSGGEE
jgi:5-methyltetrahydrofolate--homocysteine methyltransferase